MSDKYAYIILRDWDNPPSSMSSRDGSSGSEPVEVSLNKERANSRAASLKRKSATSPNAGYESYSVKRVKLIDKSLDLKGFREYGTATNSEGRQYRKWRRNDWVIVEFWYLPGVFDIYAIVGGNMLRREYDLQDAIDWVDRKEHSL